MLDPKVISDIEQGAATSAELIKNYHNELKKQFSEQQAWELLKVMVSALFGGKEVSQ